MRINYSKMVLRALLAALGVYIFDVVCNLIFKDTKQIFFNKEIQGDMIVFFLIDFIVSWGTAIYKKYGKER